MKIMTTKLLTISLLSILLLAGCGQKEKKEKSLTEGGMKCGAGKCGASMANGSALLVKKKMNIVNQMNKNDSRRDCVLKANTTKALYACVRVSETGRLSTKCATHNTIPKAIPKKEKESTMKCETGKCNGN